MNARGDHLDIDSMIDESFPPFPGLRQAAFDFLSALAANNRRDWFTERKQVFADEVQWPLRCLVVDVARRLAPTGLRLSADPRTALFRIYRDTRFSNNKDPYKISQGAVLSPDGDHRTPGGLYIHVEPGKCFLASGFWMPEPELLRAWRTRMMSDAGSFLGVVHDLASQGLQLDREDPLKRLPRGFETPSDDALVPFLQLRSFTASRETPDSAFLNPDFTDDVVRFALDSRPVLEFGWNLSRPTTPAGRLRER